MYTSIGMILEKVDRVITASYYFTGPPRRIRQLYDVLHEQREPEGRPCFSHPQRSKIYFRGIGWRARICGYAGEKLARRSIYILIKLWDVITCL